MKTLIELYDERPIENVLASEVFQPERTVFLCSAQVAQDKKLKEKLKKYFRHRGLATEPIFVETGMYNAGRVAEMLRTVTKQYPECVVDITGGTDAALFAGGAVCAELDIPAFTYSRRRNCFFNIHSAPFTDPLLCNVRHSVEDCFLMAGGALRKGRVDNAVLGKYAENFEPFFGVYLRNRADWTKAVAYIQYVSQGEKNAPVQMEVSAGYTVKGERGKRLEAPEKLLRELEKLGFVKNLKISSTRVGFTFRDVQIRNWLRDVGSVLELYVYKVCLDAGVFNDVRTSAVVDWEGDFRRDNVTNEIDVMAMCGVLPIFISCKTCAISTEALNELAILRDRFGGKSARAAIVTTQMCRTITRHRASELDIDVIDLDDLKSGRIAGLVAGLARVI